MASEGSQLTNTIAGVYAELTAEQAGLVVDALSRRFGWSTSVALVSTTLQEAGVAAAPAFEYALILCRARRMAWARSAPLGSLRSS